MGFSLPVGGRGESGNRNKFTHLEWIFHLRGSFSLFQLSSLYLLCSVAGGFVLRGLVKDSLTSSFHHSEFPLSHFSFIHQSFFHLFRIYCFFTAFLRGAERTFARERSCPRDQYTSLSIKKYFTILLLHLHV